MKEGPAESWLLLDLALRSLAARGQSIGENFAKSLLVPVAVFERSHNFGQLLNSHHEEYLAGFRSQEVRKTPRTRGVPKPLFAQRSKTGDNRQQRPLSHATTVTLNEQ